MLDIKLGILQLLTPKLCLLPLAHKVQEIVGLGGGGCQYKNGGCGLLKQFFFLFKKKIVFIPS